jgi:hypothetical protein
MVKEEMSGMKNALLFLLLVCSISIRFNVAFSQQLHLRLELEKSEFLEGEQIWAYIYLENRGTEPVPVYQFFEWELQFEVRDGAGKALQRAVWSEVYGYPPPVIVAPGENLFEMKDIPRAFANNPDRTMLKGYLIADTYSIRARFGSFDEKTRQRDTLVSNTVSFEVRKPVGAELEAFRLLTKGLDHLGEKRTHEHIEKLEELVQKYPGSVYVPGVYIQLRRTYRITLEERDRAQKYQRELLDKYPNSGAAVEELKNMVRSTSYSESEKREMLRRYSTRFPNTQIGKFSAQEIQRHLKGSK